MRKFSRLAVALLYAWPLAPAMAADCDQLMKDYGAFDNAAAYFDRASKSETSTLRSATAQSALTNIIARQGIIVNMMIATGCDLPEPPTFVYLGLISSNN